MLELLLLIGDTADHFKIDPITGDVAIVKPLLLTGSQNNVNNNNNNNQDAQSPWLLTHRLVVSARDQGQPVSRSNHTDVLIRIVPGPGALDSHSPPRFRAPRVVHLTVRENTGVSYIIAPLIPTLTQESIRAGFIRFRLADSYAVDVTDHHSRVHSSLSPRRVPPISSTDLFQVTLNTGLLVTLVNLDREVHGDFHRLSVQVSGAHGIGMKAVDYLTVEVRSRSLHSPPQPQWLR